MPAGESVSESRLKNAYNANPDGCGIMWANASQGKLYALKGYWDWYFFWSTYLLVRAAATKDIRSFIVIHFRTASASGIGYQQSHPHFVNDNLAFVHNGNFFELSSYYGSGRPASDTRTDTQRFNEEILQKLPKDFIKRPDIMAALQAYCRLSMSKLIFMDSYGVTTIINEEAGEWRDGCWFSNKGIENYSGYGYSGAYVYNVDDIRHKGGLPTVQMFGFKNRKHWWQCPECLGWFPADQQENRLCNSCEVFNQLRRFCK